MSGKNTAVFGIYPSYANVESGVDGLKSAGFSNRDISVLFPQSAGSKDFAHEKGTKAPEGATAGAGTGVILGGTMGWLLGICALAIPGLGPFIAAGPIMAMLSGAAIGGGVGGVVGGLIGWGIPEYEAKRYETNLRQGNILLSVHARTAEEAKKVEAIFKDRGGYDVKRTAEFKATANT